MLEMGKDPHGCRRTRKGAEEIWNRAATVSSAVEVMWLPSNVIPLENWHRCLSSGVPGSPGIGIFLRGSVGSILCNNTAGFFSLLGTHLVK